MFQACRSPGRILDFVLGATFTVVWRLGELAMAGGALPGGGPGGVARRGTGSLFAQMFSSSLYTPEPSLFGGF